jgi:hypothetical protein
VLELEKFLKKKFGNCFQKVRKAFLALDNDYDGYIDVQDMLRYFGDQEKIDYNDLKKLLTDKDSNRKGKLSYSDFSKWIGSTINQSEGFYFRHDSIKNPGFDTSVKKYNLNNELTQAASLESNA